MTECPICLYDIGTCEECAAMDASRKRKMRDRVGFWVTASIVAIYLIVFFGMILKQSL